MPQRPSIGDQIKRAGGVAQNAAAQFFAGAAKKWMMDHREELLAVIQQAKTERGMVLLHEFCREVPLAAGLVTLAMKGSPDMAIAAIGVYDVGLAEQLKQHRGNLEKLQECWRLGAAAKSTGG